MASEQVSRRGFLQGASLGTMGAVAAGALSAYGAPSNKAGDLAALGGSAVRTKPFPAWPQATADVEQSLVSAYRSGMWTRAASTGQVATFEKRFAELVGAKHCVATGSGTQALHTALHALGVGAGDEVLVAPCTFIASVQAILMCNALPVFVDVDIDTFQMDPAKLEPLINDNTRVIEPVHIGGLPCDMEHIAAVATRHGLKVVEDAAQAVLAEFQGKKCGTFGDLGCFSFQTSKVLACGEGGAIVGGNAELMDKCYAFQNMGLTAQNQSVGVGTKYRMNEFEAAVLNPQLATLAEHTRIRNENAAYLARRLEQIPGIVPQRLHQGVTCGTYYIYGFRYQKEHFQDAPKEKFLKALRAEGIPFTTMYFDQLNEQPFLEHALSLPVFQKIYSKQRLDRHREQNHCPCNDQLSAEGVWLPQFVFLGNTRDMDDIADALLKIVESKEQLGRL
jgi:dTDP-4-amino-4,6-dideoxygalactose transaminase